MTPADVLDSAADLLERDGWCQGVFRRADGARCVADAIDDAAAVGPDLWKLARVAVAEHLALKTPLTYWNDAPGQTAANVLATLRSVAADLRGVGQ
ncbi:MAG: hypothetical protein M3042_10220 [Actinomycetota bacterium]|nr:hypothetical protein [Actinomycetota bacterium]